MTPEIILAACLGGSLLYNIFQQVDLHRTRESYDRVLDAAARADERADDTAKIHQELITRPVQAMIPMGAIETIANAVAQYLNESGHEIIWPTKKDKLQ